MNKKTYIGIAKPIDSKTWLPFANAVGCNPEKVIKRMRDQFDDYVGVNRFRLIENWEFDVTKINPLGMNHKNSQWNRSS